MSLDSPTSGCARGDVTEPSNETIDLRGYLRPLRSRWWLAALIALAAGAMTYVFYERKPPLYAATTTLLFDAASAPGVNVDPNRYASELAFLLGTREVAGRAARRLGLPQDARALPGVVTAAESSSSNLIELTARSRSRRAAIGLVNAYAAAFVEYVGETARAAARQQRILAQRRLRRLPRLQRTRATRVELESSIEELRLLERSEQSSVRTVEPAISAIDVGDDPRRNALFALVLGALLGIGVAYVLDRLDRRVRTVADLRKLYDLPLVGAVPRATSRAEGSFLLCSDPALKEAFRGLRTTLRLLVDPHRRGGAERPITILVTSALACEGKSTVARGIADAYLDAGRRVALVDADLRRPTLAERLGLEPAPGLAEVLAGGSLHDALRVVDATTVGAGGNGARAPKRAFKRIAATLRAARSRPRAEARTSVPSLRPAGSRPTGQLADLGEPSPAPVGARPLSVLTSGRVNGDPAALLAGSDIIGVLVDLQSEHDVIVVDASPLLPVSDALSLLNLVDGVLVVGRMDFTTQPAATGLNEILAQIPDVELLGLVANFVGKRHGYSPYESYGKS